MDKESSIVFAKKYLEDVLSFFGLNTDVSASSEEDVIELGVPSTYLNGFLIGQRGETLRALQTLVMMALKNRGAELNRVNIDVADYKRQRADRLAAQTREWAKEVVASGETRALRPMSPADRRVVHRTVSEYPALETRSEGEGRDRHVVISRKADTDAGE
ncbi:MAG: KH domain-containing protein [Candidatus Chaera renei]|uniref:KH domain-containing protein n=1 Tax=Candidatus Chaera renei TaxID=2506947 RepID=A0A4Q0AIZ6_9BACT|nr:MAG: KH domain-containing protein [Candidatus Chaera renei]